MMDKQEIIWKTTRPPRSLITEKIDLYTDRKRTYKCSSPLVVFVDEEGYNGPGPYPNVAWYVPSLKQYITKSYEYVDEIRICKWSNIEYYE